MRSILRISFQSSLLKHAGEFFVLRNADFVKFRNASELCDVLFSGSFHCNIKIFGSQTCWLRINVFDFGRKLEPK